MADVAILILNWNGLRWLEPCLNAVLAQSQQADVWLVDNGSRDGSVSLVRERFPSVHVCEFDENWGFGAAYNRVVVRCEAPLVVLLNNDTAVQPGWLHALVAEAEVCPRAAAVGGTLRYLDRPDVVNHAGGQITVLGAAWDVGLGQSGELASATRSTTQTASVSCVSGAAMLLRREAFLEVEGFDDSYFAYFEDADLCWRLWLRGYKVRYTPAAHVFHAYGGSTGQGRLSPLRIEHCQANRLQSMFKNLQAETLSWALPASVAYDAYRISGLLAARHPEAARAHILGTKRFLRLVPHVLEQRKQVQASRVLSDRELFRMGVVAGVRQSAAEWRRLERLSGG